MRIGPKVPLRVSYISERVPIPIKVSFDEPTDKPFPLSVPKLTVVTAVPLFSYHLAIPSETL